MGNSSNPGLREHVAKLGVANRKDEAQPPRRRDDSRRAMGAPPDRPAAKNAAVYAETTARAEPRESVSRPAALTID